MEENGDRMEDDDGAGIEGGDEDVESVKNYHSLLCAWP